MSLPASFPGALDALANPTATTNRDDVGFELDLVISRAQDILEALEAKLGVTASLPAAGGGVLRQTGAGTSAWGKAQAGDLVGGGAANRVLRTTDGAAVAWAQVQQPDLAAASVPQYLGHVGPIGANAAGFVFNSISQAYRHLRLVFHGRSSAAAANDTLALTINTGGAFHYTQGLATSATTATAFESLGATYINATIMAGNTAPAGAAGACVIDFPNYALNGTLVKLCHIGGGAITGTTTGLMFSRAGVGCYFSAVAITDLGINPVGGQFMPGSFAALYGFN